MHVVYAAPGLILRPGMGPCEHFLSVVRGLARHEALRVSMVIGALGEVDREAAGIPSSVDVHWLRAPADAWAVTDSLALGTQPLRYLDHWRNVRRVARDLCRDGAPDALFERMWGFGGLLGAALRRRGTRLLIEENGPPGWETRQHRWTDVVRGVYLRASRLHTRRVYQSARHIVVQTEPLKQRLCDQFGAPRERVVVIPNAIDPALVQLPLDPDERARCRRELGLPEDASILLYSGTIDGSHPVRAVVGQFLASAANREGVLLLVLGTGYERDAIEAAVRTAGATTVRLLPPRRKRELFQYLRAADLALAPYDLERFRDGGFYFSPLKVREAMACDLPVALTRGAGDDLIEHEENGFLIDGPEGWGRLFDALPDRRGLARLGGGNRDRVRGYTYDHVADRYLELAGGLPAKSQQPAVGAPP